MQHKEGVLDKAYEIEKQLKAAGLRVKVDALPGKIFNGEVTAISEATGSKYSLVPTDNSAGNFVKVQQRIPVRIELENISSEEMAQLRAGMMVETEALRK